MESSEAAFAVSSVEVSLTTIEDMSTPLPGLIRLPTLNATPTAMAVVHM